MPDRLVIFDALNIIRRCWEANPAPESLAKIQETLRASTSTLRRTLAAHRPSHQVIVFDPGGTTWRHEIYPAYKQSREPMSPLLRSGLVDMQAAYARDLSLQSVTVSGVEADDVMATLALKWIDHCRGDAPIVVSTDKDLTQLQASGVRQYHPFDNNWIDDAWIQNKFGVRPEQMGDCLALMGDASDDIPGVAGIGKKTAPALLAEYGSLEAVLDAAPRIKGKLGERLMLGAESALLSRRLVALKTDVTCGLRWSMLAVPEANPSTQPNRVPVPVATSAREPRLGGW